MYAWAFPYGGGIARLRPDGTPAWYRRDYSHHEPHIVTDQTAWITGMHIGEGPLQVRYEQPKQRISFELPCAKPYIDIIDKIGPNGELLERVVIFEKLAVSRYRFLLRDTKDPCDPIHLNSVHELGWDATGGGGWVGGSPAIRPGDLVASLRNLNALVVLDRDDFDVKALVRGTFEMQHSVKHLTGSRFLVFDNWGVEADRDGSSRVLMIDLADRTETTVFPGPSTSEVGPNLHRERRPSCQVSGNAGTSLCPRSVVWRGCPTRPKTRTAVEIEALADATVKPLLAALRRRPPLHARRRQPASRASPSRSTAGLYPCDQRMPHVPRVPRVVDPLAQPAVHAAGAQHLATQENARVARHLVGPNLDREPLNPMASPPHATPLTHHLVNKAGSGTPTPRGCPCSTPPI